MNGRKGIAWGIVLVVTAAAVSVLAGGMMPKPEG